MKIRRYKNISNFTDMYYTVLHIMSTYNIAMRNNAILLKKV